MLFVVFVDFSHGNHARSSDAAYSFFVGVGSVPVQNTGHERRNQVYASFSITHHAPARRRTAGQVTVDTVFPAVPPRGCPAVDASLIRDTVVADARIVVHFDQTFALDRRFGVVGETRIHFGGDTARDQFQNFQTDVHGQFISGIHNLLRAVIALALSPVSQRRQSVCDTQDLRGVKRSEKGWQASRGWYSFIAAISPVSATTVVN